jgi:hypothetical protein
MALSNNATSPLSHQNVAQDIARPAVTASISLNNVTAHSYTVEKDVESLVCGSLPEPVPSFQQMPRQAFRSYDDIVQDAALPRTKTKHRSWAGRYNHDEENDEQIVKDVKHTTFSLPTEGGDSKRDGLRSCFYHFTRACTDKPFFQAANFPLAARHSFQSA